MKRLLFITIFLGWINICNVYAHKEWVHQYILKEAYRFLELQLGKPIPPYWRQIMRYNNGTLYAKDIDRFRKRPVESNPSATIAIYREDEFDALYGFGGLINTSTTHFWDADYGIGKTNFGLVYGNFIGQRPNAYVKAYGYMFGHPSPDTEWYGNIGVEGNYYNDFFGSNNQVNHETYAKYISYKSLFELFSKGQTTVRGYREFKPDNNGGSVDIDLGIEEVLSPARRELYALHFLGRVIHLLTDMSVPAHVHSDTHACDIGNGDTFELEMGGNLGLFNDCNEFHNSFSAMEWTAETAMNDDIVGGGILFSDAQLQQSSNDKLILYELFYSLNQLADFFPSSTFTYSWSGGGTILNYYAHLIYPILLFFPYMHQEDGDVVHDVESLNLINFNILSSYLKIIDKFGNKSHSNSNPLFFSDYYKVRGKILINFAIRATATLLRWFMLRTGIEAKYEPYNEFTVDLLGADFLRNGQKGHYRVVTGNTGLNDPEWFLPSQMSYEWYLTYHYQDQNRNHTVNIYTPEVDLVMDDADSVTVGVMVRPANTAIIPKYATITASRYRRPDSPTLAFAKSDATIQSKRMQPILRTSKYQTNDFTELSYSIPGEKHVQLEVLNSEYKQVARLVSELQHEGKYNEKLNVASLPEGSYIIRLTAIDPKTGEKTKEAAPLYVKR